MLGRNEVNSKRAGFEARIHLNAHIGGIPVDFFVHGGEEIRECDKRRSQVAHIHPVRF
jgi:hypothetical protein